MLFLLALGAAALPASSAAAKQTDKLRSLDYPQVEVGGKMGRTPTFNKQDGKDHWSVGSIMFIGPGNRVIGATDEKQLHVPLNPQTLATDRDKGIRVRPEHIHTALRQFAGIADHPHSKKFPFVIPEKERLLGLWG